MLSEVGVQEEYVWLISCLYSEVLNANGNREISNDVENVLDRKPMDFVEYALETAQTGVWNKDLQVPTHTTEGWQDNNLELIA